MATSRMSVHRGLAELKLYGNKIETLSNSQFVVANKLSNKTIGGRTVDELTNQIKGHFDKMVALIENRKRIKDAIVQSNAVTIVDIGDREMTVAQAIERKNSVEFEKQFLYNLKRQFMAENGAVEKANNELPSKLETYLEKTLGTEKREIETVKALTKVFEDTNKYGLIDPSHIQNYITKLEEEINDFETKVDYSLSEVNATTFFEVDLAD